MAEDWGAPVGFAAGAALDTLDTQLEGPCVKPINFHLPTDGKISP